MEPFDVTVLVTKKCSFNIEANTPEEAENIAEQYIREGFFGAEEIESVEPAEALPA